MNTVTRARYASTAARWQKAAQRATSEGVQVRQLAGSGQRIATSASDASTAYELDITGAIAHGCTCLAGLNDDPVCKHRAAYYLLIGALGTEPEPPAPAQATCRECGGGGVEYSRELEKLGLLYPPCLACRGSGLVAA